MFFKFIPEEYWRQTTSVC